MGIHDAHQFLNASNEDELLPSMKSSLQKPYFLIHQPCEEKHLVSQGICRQTYAIHHLLPVKKNTWALELTKLYITKCTQDISHGKLPFDNTKK